MKFEWKEPNRAGYAQLKSKLFLRFLCLGGAALLIIVLFYFFLWRGQGGDLVVRLFQRLLGLGYESAWTLYQRIFIQNRGTIWIMAIVGMFFVLLLFSLNWFTRYFDIASQGIDALLNEDEAEIRLPSELLAIERKLNAVKQTLRQRTLAVKEAEQRKNDLVMYLAHDIRTPLTSVIGYLSLLEEAPDMPMQQRAKYVHITLEKAERLEKMMNEFFEITRYNLQEITLAKEPIDLYYMLVQLSDELSPVLSPRGNTVVLKADEDLTIFGDPDKLARVFNNVLKNAAAYGYPETEILISAEERGGSVVISFENQGDPIPLEKLSTIFEKFHRLDEARASHTGGTGLGLSIAKEIVSLHGGTIAANSRGGVFSIVITLPAARL